MENTKTFDERIADLKNVNQNTHFVPGIASLESLNQMIKAHELKYIEFNLEVSEENKLVEDNIEDFLKYSPEAQEAALAAFEHSKRDPDYFSKPGVDQGLMKPVMILNNIDVKKNEVKIKTWKVEYHARLIRKMKEMRSLYSREPFSVGAFVSSIINKIFSK